MTLSEIPYADREKSQTAESPNSPKPFRFPHALRLDGLDCRRFIFIVERVESRSTKKR